MNDLIRRAKRSSAEAMNALMPPFGLGNPPTRQRRGRSVTEQAPTIDDEAGDEEMGPELNSEDEAFIGKLKEIWQVHDEQSLPLRHQMGLLVIAKLQELKQDPERGETVLREAADRLGMNPSDLSRLRAFAARFPTFEDFTKAHADVKSWSGVKKLLAKLSQAERKGGNAKTKEKKTSPKQVESMVKELRSIKDFIADAKEDFSIKQAAEVEQISEGILGEIEAVAAPLKKMPKSQGG